MTDLLRTISLYLVSEQCYDKYFLEYDFFDVNCFTSLLSKCLGLGIVAGSMLVKVPQILKIVKNRSGEGISIASVLVEICAITAHISYNYVKGFPFSAWGDGAFLAIQTAAIAALVFYFGGAKGRAGAFLIGYLGVLYVLMGGITPLHVLWSMQACNVPVIFIGKMLQAVTNYRNQSTGQLSPMTCYMLFFGALARIFTSYKETGDPMMILTYAVSSLANGIIVFQLIYYAKAKKGKKTKTEKSAQVAKPKPRSKKVD
ncbi:mannose-P-dolichol utilization defect 1 protein homolog [Lutzomyia longipalpis]|uniref:Mannose-P-dolichol utilization defect 1 protein homolog n=1 Tax=Lutzomyia longipalpis TaxID=7200 RepID=A0A1B0GHY6_LUTLO|nr:mannose-P-dolichol utilization defect 1 protein homolog [Lutzomyia longipalpis]